MALFDTVKRVVEKVLEGKSLLESEIAEVIEVNPLVIKFDQRYQVTEEFIILTERVTEYKVDLSHTHSYSGGATGSALDTEIDIRSGLQVDDKVLILRMQGGQSFAIIDKVVNV